jgi:hypothetical protein
VAFPIFTGPAHLSDHARMPTLTTNVDRHTTTNVGCRPSHTTRERWVSLTGKRPTAEAVRGLTVVASYRLELAEEIVGQEEDQDHGPRDGSPSAAGAPHRQG